MEDPKIITKSLRRKENEAIEDVGTLTRKFKVGVIDLLLPGS